MYNDNQFYESYDEQSQSRVRSNFYFSKVFLWMFAGVLVTALFAFLISLSPNAIMASISFPFIIVTGIVQIVIAISLSKNALFRLNTTKTIVLFFLYAALNGLTFGFLFYIVSARDLFYIFLISAGYFGLMAALSSLFKNALSKASNFFLIGLACLLIMSIVSAIFWYNNTLMLAVSIVGLIIFGGLTAFDVRWIKNMMDNSPNASSLAIYGAFHLYLDFINIFVYLVRIFASTNRN